MLKSPKTLKYNIFLLFSEENCEVKENEWLLELEDNTWKNISVYLFKDKANKFLVEINLEKENVASYKDELSLNKTHVKIIRKINDTEVFSGTKRLHKPLSYGWNTISLAMKQSQHIIVSDFSWKHHRICRIPIRQGYKLINVRIFSRLFAVNCNSGNYNNIIKKYIL